MIRVSLNLELLVWILNYSPQTKIRYPFLVRLDFSNLSQYLWLYFINSHSIFSLKLPHNIWENVVRKVFSMSILSWISSQESLVLKQSAGCSCRYLLEVEIAYIFQMNYLLELNLFNSPHRINIHRTQISITQTKFDHSTRFFFVGFTTNSFVDGAWSWN